MKHLFTMFVVLLFAFVMAFAWEELNYQNQVTKYSNFRTSPLEPLQVGVHAGDSVFGDSSTKICVLAPYDKAENAIGVDSKSAAEIGKLMLPSVDAVWFVVRINEAGAEAWGIDEYTEGERGSPSECFSDIKALRIMVTVRIKVTAAEDERAISIRKFFNFPYKLYPQRKLCHLHFVA